MTRAWLVAELLLIYIALPSGYRFSPVHIPALPLLWLVAGYAFWQLRRNTRFDRAGFLNFTKLPKELRSIVVMFLIGAFGIWLGVRVYAPNLQWSLLRQSRVFWAVIMVAYPVLSVYPQGLIYRAFFFERYAQLFPGKWQMIAASAAAFAFLHIIFRNWLAVDLTLVGGLLFAWRYTKTRSVGVSGFEHALYGCWLFTVGLGDYFYHGTVAAVGTVVRH